MRKTIEFEFITFPAYSNIDHSPAASISVKRENVHPVQLFLCFLIFLFFLSYIFNLLSYLNITASSYVGFRLLKTSFWAPPTKHSRIVSPLYNKCIVRDIYKYMHTKMISKQIDRSSCQSKMV